METKRKGLSFLVAPWGQGNEAEITNAVYEANDIQESIRFEPYEEFISLNEKPYMFMEDCYDLDKAAKKWLATEDLSWLGSKELILVTSLPYSAPGAEMDDPDPRFRGLFFYDDAVRSKGKQVSIISTCVWDRLPPDKGLPPLIPWGGRRALKPYLLYAFAMVALARCIVLGYHDDRGGCPQNYNHYVKDCDRFFSGGRFCSECEDKITRKIKNHPEQEMYFDAVRRLLNVSTGRPPGYEYHFAISFAGSEREKANRLRIMLQEAGLYVFYDDEESERLVGGDVGNYLSDVFGRKAQSCVILVSKSYKNRKWTAFEYDILQARAKREGSMNFLLPIVVDPVKLPGLPDKLGYLSLKKYPIDKIADILIKKVRG